MKYQTVQQHLFNWNQFVIIIIMHITYIARLHTHTHKKSSMHTHTHTLTRNHFFDATSVEARSINSFVVVSRVGPEEQFKLNVSGQSNDHLSSLGKQEWELVSHLSVTSSQVCVSSMMPVIVPTLYMQSWPSGKLSFECQKIVKNLPFFSKKLPKIIIFSPNVGCGLLLVLQHLISILKCVYYTIS